MTQVDGVMVGREAYQNPAMLLEVDQRLFADDYKSCSRQEVIEQLIPYVETELPKGVRLNSITRHTLGLFHGMPRARSWRRYLSENAPKNGADVSVLLEALKTTAL